MSGATAGGAPDEEETTGAFRRSRGRVSARFTAAQAVILRNLVSQVAELMGRYRASRRQVCRALGFIPRLTAES